MIVRAIYRRCNEIGGISLVGVLKSKDKSERLSTTTAYVITSI